MATGMAVVVKVVVAGWVVMVKVAADDRERAEEAVVVAGEWEAVVSVAGVTARVVLARVVLAVAAREPVVVVVVVVTWASVQMAVRAAMAMAVVAVAARVMVERAAAVAWGEEVARMAALRAAVLRVMAAVTMVAMALPVAHLRELKVTVEAATEVAAAAVVETERAVAVRAAVVAMAMEEGLEPVMVAAASGREAYEDGAGGDCAASVDGADDEGGEDGVDGGCAVNAGGEGGGYAARVDGADDVCEECEGGAYVVCGDGAGDADGADGGRGGCGSVALAPAQERLESGDAESGCERVAVDDADGTALWWLRWSTVRLAYRRLVAGCVHGPRWPAALLTADDLPGGRAVPSRELSTLPSVTTDCGAPIIHASVRVCASRTHCKVDDSCDTLSTAWGAGAGCRVRRRAKEFAIWLQKSPQRW